MRLLLASFALALLSACATPVVVAGPPEPSAPPAEPLGPREPRPSPAQAARNFSEVVDRVMPLARSFCARRTRGVRCDYAVVIDKRSGIGPNAFQTLSPEGRPIVGFTLSLIQLARNTDELAFILSHEAAHHIAGHIARGRASAQSNAALAGALVALGGGNPNMVFQAQQVGAFYGSRRYAKEFELEADALGARLALAAGYDPIRGARFFADTPDPGNRFLGTHPPNADRIAAVRRAVGR